VEEDQTHIRTLYTKIKLKLISINWMINKTQLNIRDGKDKSKLVRMIGRREM
jgi:hypothetical protein